MLVNCWVLAASHVQQEHWYKEAQKASLPGTMLREPLQAILLNLLSQQIKKLCILKASSASQLLCPGCKSCSTGALVQGSSEGLAARINAERAFASNPAELAELADKKALHLESLQC